MRLLPALLLIAATHLSSQVGVTIPSPPGNTQSRKSAKIEGKVIDSTSGGPLAMATLTLWGDKPAEPPKYTVKSDMEGTFLFDHVEPGRYILHAEKPGFIGQDYAAKRSWSGGTPLRVLEGQDLKDVLLKLTPQGVICGKVTDETGEPMDTVSVGALQWGYSPGNRFLRPVRSALTDDRGEYRIANLSPGTYYLGASRGTLMARQFMVAIAHARSAPGPETPEEDYGTTYYPDSSDPQAAAPVEVIPGSEISDIDIQARKVSVFRVSGQVIDGTTGQPAVEAKVTLLPPITDSVASLPGLSGPWIPGGKFEITDVFPGPYVLMAQVNKKGETLYARQPVNVADQSVTDVIITISQAVNVVGRLRVSGVDFQTEPQRQQQQSQPHAFKMDSVRIVLLPAEGLVLGSLPEAAPQADGSFVLRDVVPDKLRLLVRGAPPRWYLKSILVGGKEAPDGIADLTSGKPIEVVLAMGPGEVTGSVVDADDKPAPGVPVTLVPEEAGKQGRIDLFRITKADQDGRFQLEGVVPGSYEIFAWEEVDPAAVHDSEFLRAFESSATSITLEENRRETVRLKAISVEDVARALGDSP